MLYTTFDLLREGGACKNSYRRLGTVMGGIKKYGRDILIPFSIIVESGKFTFWTDIIWALRWTTDRGASLSLLEQLVEETMAPLKGKRIPGISDIRSDYLREFRTLLKAERKNGVNTVAPDLVFESGRQLLAEVAIRYHAYREQNHRDNYRQSVEIVFREKDQITINLKERFYMLLQQPNIDAVYEDVPVKNQGAQNEQDHAPT